MEIELQISKQAVMDEVAQATNYSGDKMKGDEGAYGRISTVDEDEAELVRFWDECRAEVAQAFIRLLVSEGMEADGDTYKVTLNVSESFDCTALLSSMVIGLFNYFVQGIIARWYVYTNKEEAVSTSTRASAILEETKEKAFYKSKPVRPRYL